ncbi:hypothetical protein PRN20_09620 [Devosia sp. ZB163]|uniref:hypothetical protein n=1 Tax=Devosia sp. ZB163 TaxID=3025938 RepID=UPI002360CE3A|nr:hypothetical protein [Devosia sp. ZB163]MDC9823993.1 hypothetical protein [Devosia sp. ZB163]
MSSRKTPSVSIRPHHSPLNRYVNLFAAAFTTAGWRVRRLRWRPGEAWGSQVNIVHWPNDMFSPVGRRRWQATGKLLLMRLSRSVFGTRWIWVVHNLQPHDRGEEGGKIWRAFLGQLDGLVFLSRHSRDQFAAAYPFVRATSVVVRHGHYRSGAVRQAGAFAPPTADRPLRLQFAGLVRPYKNVDGLIEATRPLAGLVDLNIKGLARDPHIRSLLSRLAAGANNISLHLASEPLEEAEIEDAVDAAHAVILPYRHILNSGVALLSLSRNRPVIAPAVGSLKELRAEVGPEWVHLYEGELTSDVLRRAADWVRSVPRRPTSPLHLYDWDRLGPEIVAFAASLRS